MNSLKFILLAVALVLTIDNAKSQDIDAVICWTENIKLQGVDFQGMVPLNEKTSTKIAVCSANIRAIPIKEGSLWTYRIRVFFNKKESWAKDTISSKTLAHEQLHFDIAELYGRKMRKAINEANFPRETNTSNLRSIVYEFLNEMYQAQDDYDLETGSGLANDAQKEVEKRIYQELATLVEYASTSKDCE